VLTDWDTRIVSGQRVPDSAAVVYRKRTPSQIGCVRVLTSTGAAGGKKRLMANAC